MIESEEPTQKTTSRRNFLKTALGVSSVVALPRLSIPWLDRELAESTPKQYSIIGVDYAKEEDRTVWYTKDSRGYVIWDIG